MHKLISILTAFLFLGSFSHAMDKCYNKALTELMRQDSLKTQLAEQTPKELWLALKEKLDQFDRSDANMHKDIQEFEHIDYYLGHCYSVIEHNKEMRSEVNTIAAPLQKILAILKELAFTFTLASHHRLGKNSPANALSKELFKEIGEHVINDML